MVKLKFPDGSERTEGDLTGKALATGPALKKEVCLSIDGEREFGCRFRRDSEFVTERIRRAQDPPRPYYGAVKRLFLRRNGVGHDRNGFYYDFDRVGDCRDRSGEMKKIVKEDAGVLTKRKPGRLEVSSLVGRGVG